MRIRLYMTRLSPSAAIAPKRPISINPPHSRRYSATIQRESGPVSSTSSRLFNPATFSSIALVTPPTSEVVDSSSRPPSPFFHSWPFHILRISRRRIDEQQINSEQNNKHTTTIPLKVNRKMHTIQMNTSVLPDKTAATSRIRLLAFYTALNAPISYCYQPVIQHTTVLTVPAQTNPHI